MAAETASLSFAMHGAREALAAGAAHIDKAARDEAWDLPRLLKEMLGLLRLAPAGLGVDNDPSDSIRKTAGGLQTVIQGICEIGRSHGFASHRKDPAVQQLDAAQALRVARAAGGTPASSPVFADLAGFEPEGAEAER